MTDYKDGHSDTVPTCNVLPRKGGPAPARVTPEMARQEAQRLLPHPPIGTAPTGHATLVNIQTVLWVDTTSERNLGTVTLLGQRVTLAAHLRRVHWRFGDGHTDSSATPGRPYTVDDPCSAAQCPQYFGHTYTRTGHDTLTATLTWTGRFRVGDGPWQAIPGTVTAAATPAALAVRQARGVLVPNP